MVHFVFFCYLKIVINICNCFDFVCWRNNIEYHQIDHALPVSN